MISARSRLQAYQTTASNGRQELLADAPVEKGGGGAGFSAHELLEAALAVCVNMAVRMYASEHSIRLDGVMTHVTLKRPRQGVVRFEYAVELTGPLSAAHREELRQAASACPVHDTLSKRIEFQAVQDLRSPAASGSHPSRAPHMTGLVDETKDERDVALDYDRFMGRWSALMAAQFIDWLHVPPGLRWLDVGCGTGSLTAAILARAAPLEVSGVDPEEAYVRHASERLGGDRRHFMVGDARRLPDELRDVDVAVSGLVLNLLPEPAAGVREKLRVTRPGGVVAAYVWDFAGGMRLLRHLWDAARTFDPGAEALDQGNRYALCRPEPLRALFGSAGATAVDVQALQITTLFRDFNDYWEALANGNGHAPAYVRSLAPRQRERLRNRIQMDLPAAPDGSIPLTARAWAVRGTRG